MDKTIKIWHSEAPYECIATLTGHSYIVSSLADSSQTDRHKKKWVGVFLVKIFGKERASDEMKIK